MKKYIGKIKFSGLLLLLGIPLLLAVSCNNPQEHVHESENGVGRDIAYTCPMHPQIVEQEPGICPICAMDLVPVSKGDAASPEIMLSESQKLLANIRTEQVNVSKMGNTTRLNARLAENKEEVEVVSSRVPGRIERLFVKERGQRIQAGQALYEIYSEELLTYQQEYLLALEQFDQLGQDEPRYGTFLESARRKLKLYGMTEGQIQQLKTDRNPRASFTFVSPVSGIVTEIAVTEGLYVSEGGKLYTIGRLDTLWVEAELYPQESERVQEGDQVRVQVAGYENEPVNGRVSFISPQYRGGSQILTMRIEIANPGARFLPGMQANVLLSSGDTDVISVPVQAVIRDGSGAHVWLQTSDSTFLARRVETGIEEPQRLAITSGLQAADRVVVNGAYLLYSEFVLKKGGNPVEDNMEMEGKAMLDAHDPITGPPAFANKQFEEAYPNYLQLKDALVASEPAQAQAQALLLQNALNALEGAEKAEAYAAQLAATNQLEKQRELFFFLSNHMIQLIEQKELTSGGLYVQYCPMANNDQGAYWLSTEEEIRNPYFGDMMLSCGEVSDIIQ
jgi:Cu(I)/Ag(I) efflux system membrane fusion protein